MKVVIMGEKRIECDLCDNLFHVSNIKWHIRILHNGEKLQKCKNCDKSFGHALSLKKHIEMIHEAIKYECDCCDKSFSTLQSMKKHIHTVHEGHKDHKCNSCDKLFTEAKGFSIFFTYK